MFTHLSFATLPVRDQDRALAFYTDTMGMSVSVDAPYGDMRWIMLEMPGARTRLHLDRVDAPPRTDKPAIPLIAEDVGGAVESLRGKGVEIVADARPAEWDADTTYAIIRDSEGNLVLIASR